MYTTVLSCIIYVSFFCDASKIFHENTKSVFYHSNFSDYFGYSVVLTDKGLIVSAPKALSATKNATYSGMVFNCSLRELHPNNFCDPMKIVPDDKLVYKRTTGKDFFRNDMWFGATLASVPNEKFMICAPRWTDPFTDMHLLATGACYIHTKRMDIILTPLMDNNKQAFMTDGRRREFGDRNQHINYYAYSELGMSIKVTDNNVILLGAPGLLQWTGGVVSYKFIRSESSIFFSKQTVSNPYFTNDLEPDDYFGYSVESGIFKHNGPTFYVGGAPRARRGYGQVIIFEPAVQETGSLNIQAKIKGPHLGSYFGASLACTDIDGDGIADLLVGAPNFVKQDGGLPYDQGAVFVYLTRELNSRISFVASGYVTGSSKSGARFGTTIANLGDIDGDGFTDIAIGAPWENKDMGVVYIYRGDNKGLKSHYVQRIFAENAQGFGFSISKGLDVNNDNCNDLAIGAYKSRTAYIYRCVPTVQVRAYIKVPDALNIPQNATGFTAFFCVTAPQKTLWPHAKLKLKAKITVDPEGNRAFISGDSVYPVIVKPGYDACDEQTIEVLPTADLSRPILMKFELMSDEILKENSTIFIRDAARLSEDSQLKSSFLIQLVRDCGEDLICTPWLVVSLLPLSDPYIPGSATSLGVTLTVLNKAEPAYAIKVHVILPAHPVRIPNDCSIQDLNITCDIAGPLLRNAQIQWIIELEYTLKDQNEEDLRIAARIEEPLTSGNISKNDELTDDIELYIRNEANFTIKGIRKQNESLPVSREKLNKAENFTFVHYFEVLNSGPSDWFNLEAHLLLPEKVNLMAEIEGCNMEINPIECVWSVPANVTLPIVLLLFFDLSKHGDFLERNITYNISTQLLLNSEDRYESSIVTTILVLDPVPPIWPLITGIIGGLIVLATIIFILHRCGFFSRKQREQLKKLQGQNVQLEEQSGPSSSDASIDANESTQELITDESD